MKKISEKLKSDIVELRNNGHFTFNEIAAEARKCFGDLFNERLFREQLSYHADINYSEPVEYLVPVPPDDEIKQFLIDKRWIFHFKVFRKLAWWFS